jgi:hypothetical protein
MKLKLIEPELAACFFTLRVASKNQVTRVGIRMGLCASLLTPDELEVPSAATASRHL